MTDDKMICEIYKSARKDEMYLYVEKTRGLKDVPESLLEIFGRPAPLMTLLIRADKPGVGGLVEGGALTRWTSIEAMEAALSNPQVQGSQVRIRELLRREPLRKVYEVIA